MKKKLWLIVPFLIIFVVTLPLFYLYIHGIYGSDYGTHIHSALNHTGYSLMHVLFLLCYKLYNGYRLMILMMSGIVAITPVMVYLMLQFFAKQFDVRINRAILFCVSFTSIFWASLYLMKNCHLYYKFTSLTQPWHNSTYLLMRLLAIGTLWVYVYIEKDYKKTIKPWAWCLFTVLLTLTNLAKSNFIIAFAPMMILFMLYDFIRTRGKNFKNAAIFGLGGIISCVVTLVQYKMLFSESSGSGIEWNPTRAIDIVTSGEWLTVVVANLICPIIVGALACYVIFIKKTTVNSLRIYLEAWVMFAISRFQAMCISETGARAADGNFSWGEYFFAWYLYLITALLLMEIKPKINKVIYYAIWGLYLWHFLSGVYYFDILMNGSILV